MERAKAAGAVGLIGTFDWSFSNGRDWGSRQFRADGPEDHGEARPGRAEPPALVRRVPPGGHIPGLTVPNLAAADEEPPTFFGAYGKWMQTPPPSWDDVRWMREQWTVPSC